MTWQPTPHSLLALFATAVSAVLFGVAWGRRSRQVAWPFLALVVAIGGWSAAYAVQLGYGSVAEQLFWQRLGLAVGGTTPTLWLVLAVAYVGREGWLTRRRVLALAAEPFLFGLLCWTNPAHGLVLRAPTLLTGAGVPVVQFALGPAYVAHIAYAYVSVGAGLGLIWLTARRSPETFGLRAGTLMLGALPPVAANLAFTFGVSPVPGLDLTPFAFGITVALWALALFRFDLLELGPIARRRSIDVVGDGLLVVDDRDRVVDWNDNAERVLGTAPEAGTPLRELLPVEDGSELDGTVVGATVDGTRRQYALRRSPVSDQSGRPVGSAVAMRDVTESREY